MKIQVTADHILQGKRGSCSRCPVALAIQGECAPGVVVNVNGFAVKFTSGGGLFGTGCSGLPAHARLFIYRFDDRGLDSDSAVPFEFDLDIPAVALP